MSCASIPVPDQIVLGPSYQPKNFFRQSTSLPESLRRVAVLPLAAAVDDSLGNAGREALQPTVYMELSKCKAFELIYVSVAELKLWTGKTTWGAEEKLPLNFFERLHEQTGCDAVLFSQMTQYRPYKPVALGWQFKLADSKEPKVWWSADEVFDGSERSVSNAARRYSLEHFKDSTALNDSYFILSSPRRFGQYTLSALLTTLPSR